MIEASELTRYYGSFLAVDGVTFSVPSGEVAGLLGLNGAGKTTCLRLLTGYLTPDSGSVLVDGIDMFENPGSARAKIGYLPEVPPLYPELTVYDTLKFVASMREFPLSQFESEFQRVVELTELQNARSVMIRNLSLGYRKRVGIAQALIGSPPVIVLDEPVSGLDPRQIVEMRKLIRSLAGTYTVVLSSHILNEVSLTCDRVFIIHQGKLAGELAGEQMKELEPRFMELTKSNLSGQGGMQ